MDAMCDVDGTDPYTMSARLCDDDGIVRRGAMHHGTDYQCTSHAHFGGEHIRCTSPAHRPQPYSGTWVYASTGSQVTVHPAAVGRQIVEAINAYSARSGRRWR